jgi:hypothetical protein
MDAPLLVQPIVIPQEVQRQAHNYEVINAYPLSFFEATLRKEKASEIKDVEILKSRLETEGSFTAMDSHMLLLLLLLQNPAVPTQHLDPSWTSLTCRLELQIS